MLEHMMFKGTKKYGPKTFSQTVQRNGGNDNAFTSHDYTAYFETFAADRIGISLDLESDRMQNLLIEPKEFSSEREVVKEERRMRYEDDPVNTMVEQMMSVAFSAHPYQWPVIGWMADIDNFTRDDLYNHYRTYYVPNNATIVVVGDFDTKTLLAGSRNISARYRGVRTYPRWAPSSRNISASGGSSSADRRNCPWSLRASTRRP